MTRSLLAFAAGIALVAACNADQARQQEIEAAAAKAAEAAYEKGKAEAEQTAARAQQQQQAEREAAAAEAERAQQEQAQREAAAEEVVRAAIQQEKASLRRNPTKFLIVSDPKVRDKGFVNSYRQLSQITVLNRSKYAVTNVSGEVDWTKDDGTKLGTTTFSLAGSLPAGDTKTFATASGTLQSTTLQGNAATHTLRFSQVEIVE